MVYRSMQKVRLGEVVKQVWRDESVNPAKEFSLLGTHWYALGLYVKEIKPGTRIKASKLFRVEEGDFVYNRLFAWKGAFAVATAENDGCYVSNEFPCFRVNSDRLDAQYLLHYFGRQSTWNAALGLSYGATPTSRNRLKENHFLSLKIPLPPLSEQRRIVAKIDRLAAKIEKAIGLRRASDNSTSLLWMLEAKRLLESIEQAKWETLGNIVIFGGGGTPSKKNPAFWDGDIPWVSPKDIKSREIRNSLLHITKIGLDRSSAKLYEPGTVLVVVRGMILAHTFPSAVLRVAAAINQDIKALMPEAKLLPEYLCTALWGLNERFLDKVARSGHDTRRFDTNILKAMKIPVPAVEEQRRIVEYLDGLQARVDRLKALQTKTAAELDAMLPSILDKAFKGVL